MKTKFRTRQARGFYLVLPWFSAGLLILAISLTSCNVTRTVTTKSEYWQRGDTSVIIQTKTIESYDGSRK